MLCLGIGNIRAKFTERKEEKHLPVAHCPPLACCFSIYFFAFKLLAPVYPKGRRKKAERKTRRAASPAPLPCAGWLAARRCQGQALLTSPRFPA